MSWIAVSTSIARVRSTHTSTPPLLVRTSIPASIISCCICDQSCECKKLSRLLSSVASAPTEPVGSSC
eukprot:scaffold10721_cov75-Phaeocystis_antarctica.AAC.1